MVNKLETTEYNLKHTKLNFRWDASEPFGDVWSSWATVCPTSGAAVTPRCLSVSQHLELCPQVFGHPYWPASTVDKHVSGWCTTHLSYRCQLRVCLSWSLLKTFVRLAPSLSIMIVTFVKTFVITCFLSHHMVVSESSVDLKTHVFFFFPLP